MTDTFEVLSQELQSTLSADTTAPWLRTDILFRKLLGCQDERAAQLVVDVLHGKHGAGVARGVWKLVQAGIPPHYDAFVSQGCPRFSLAATCLMRRTIAIFEAVVLSGAPEAVPMEHPLRNQIDWMDWVSGTDKERSALKLELMTRPNMTPLGTVGEIATFADVFPAAAREAFEVVWRLAPHHPGFDELAQEPSEPGAAVRAFLMSKRMAQVAVMPASCESTSALTRRRRASV